MRIPVASTPASSTDGLAESARASAAGGRNAIANDTLDRDLGPSLTTYRDPTLSMTSSLSSNPSDRCIVDTPVPMSRATSDNRIPVRLRCSATSAGRAGVERAKLTMGAILRWQRILGGFRPLTASAEGTATTGQSWYRLRAWPASRTLVVPITTRAASAHLEPPYLVHASARDLQLSWDGWIHADQVFTFPTAELDERIGLLPGRKMAELDQALRFELDV